MLVRPNLPRSLWIPPEQILKKLPETVLATIDDIKRPKNKQLRGGIDSSFLRLFFVTEDNFRSSAWLGMTPEVCELMGAHPRYIDTFIGLDYRMKFAFYNLRSFIEDISLNDADAKV